MFEAVMGGLAILLVLGVAVIVLVILIHFSTTSRETDQMGWFASGDYRKFLKRKPPQAAQLDEIPPPPDGKRDLEVEDLIMSGKTREARELLQIRLEEAKLAPVGSEAKIRRVAHYTALLGKD
jgi:hypothetical protein